MRSGSSGDGCHHEKDPAGSTPSHSTPICSSAAGSRPESFEQQTQIDGTGLPSPVTSAALKIIAGSRDKRPEQ